MNNVNFKTSYWFDYKELDVMRKDEHARNAILNHHKQALFNKLCDNIPTFTFDGCWRIQMVVDTNVGNVSARVEEIPIETTHLVLPEPITIQTIPQRKLTLKERFKVLLKGELK